MQIINEIAGLRNAVAKLRKQGHRIGLVPTMGALHDGHISLVKAVQPKCDAVVASIFVNPKQFGEGEDLDAYPRTLDDDAAMLKAAGTDIVWAPKASEIYGNGFATRVEVDGLTNDFCGKARPGHFDGVALIVSKLFNQVRPDVAVFGQKDWQQLAIIRRMARDLDFDIEVMGAPTMRTPDGLAMSSRNRYMSAEQMEAALTLPRALQQAASEIRSGGDIAATLDKVISALRAAGFDEPDYVALVDEDSLQRLTKAQSSGMRLIAAAKMGKTRLIDNLTV